jgi:NUMOD3 motif
MINWPTTFKESKYSKWYNSLILKAQIRGKVNGYKEIHHIIPKSFGGSNLKSNLVELTAREHYIAHALLWKMNFSGEYGSKMSFAFNTFIQKFKTSEHSYKINSKIYEIFRKQYAELLSKKLTGEGNHFYGKKHSDETKRIIGEKSKLKEFKTGPENPNWGKKLNMTLEGAQRKTDAAKKNWANPAFRQMMIDKRKAFLETPEGKALTKAQADSRRGVKRDPAIMEKCAAAKRGKKENEIYSPEAILKRKEAIKNRVISPEARAKMGYKGKGKGIPKVKKPCPHCGKMCAGNMLVKWHGENCKLNNQK